MVSFKILKSLSSKIVICLYIYIYIYLFIYLYVWHLKIFLLYLLTCRVVEVLIIYKFLAYITKNKFHKLQNISI